MNMQVKLENGNYICLKHNQIVVLVVMDDKVSLENKMLCNACILQNRSPLNQALSVQQALEMIKEKLNQQTSGEDETNSYQLKRLKTLQSKLNELRQQFLVNMDIITSMIEQWINELILPIKKESIDLIKGFQLLQQEEIKVEQNKAYIMKMDSAFKKLLNIDEISQCYTYLKTINNVKPIQTIKQKKQSNYKQIINKQLGQINYINIGNVKYEGYFSAIAFNKIEDQLISCQFDKNIKIWSVQQKKNYIENEYPLENRHTDWIIGSNNKQIKLWSRQNSNLICNYSVLLSNQVYSIGENQLLIQLGRRELTNDINLILINQQTHQICSINQIEFVVIKNSRQDQVRNRIKDIQDQSDYDINLNDLIGQYNELIKTNLDILIQHQSTESSIDMFTSQGDNLIFSKQRIKLILNDRGRAPFGLQEFKIYQLNYK